MKIYKAGCINVLLIGKKPDYIPYLKFEVKGQDVGGYLEGATLLALGKAILNAMNYEPGARRRTR